MLMHSGQGLTCTRTCVVIILVQHIKKQVTFELLRRHRSITSNAFGKQNHNDYMYLIKTQMADNCPNVHTGQVFECHFKVYVPQHKQDLISHSHF